MSEISGLFLRPDWGLRTYGGIMSNCTEEMKRRQWVFKEYSF